MSPKPLGRSTGYSAHIRLRVATAITALAIAGCGTRTATHSTTDASVGPVNGHAHPQAVQPIAGDVGGPATPVARGGPATGPPHPPGPGQVASVTAAPAHGAPTDAEVRAAVRKFQAAVHKYHLDQLNLSYAILDPAQLPPGQFYTSIASVYTDYGLGIACGGVLHVAQLGVANKTLPCGTMVTFVYGGRAIRVPVIDRGPYIAGRVWDLTGATAEALKFPGLGPIEWRLG
jgi:rare lipoprotein A (RlpA)-like double-psi beta-barrel protein